MGAIIGLLFYIGITICCCYCCYRYYTNARQQWRVSLTTNTALEGTTVRLSQVSPHSPSTYQYAATPSGHTDNPPSSYQYAATPSGHTDNPPSSYQNTAIPPSGHTDNPPTYQQVTTSNKHSTHKIVTLTKESSRLTYPPVYRPADLDIEASRHTVEPHPNQQVEYSSVIVIPRRLQEEVVVVPPPENECRHLQATETNVELNCEASTQQEPASERHSPEIHGPEIRGGYQEDSTWYSESVSVQLESENQFETQQETFYIGD